VRRTTTVCPRLLYFIDGNQLLQWCEANNPACVGDVAGVSDELNVNRTLMQNVPSCTSEGATTEQLADMVVNISRASRGAIPFGGYVHGRHNRSSVVQSKLSECPHAASRRLGLLRNSPIRVSHPATQLIVGCPVHRKEDDHVG
jgi:hypothetical protein